MSSSSTVRVAAGPRPLRYLAIDGTHEKDSVAFGRELAKLGWKNLLDGVLPEVPSSNPTSQFGGPAYPA
jgi:hypothetical protein